MQTMAGFDVEDEPLHEGQKEFSMRYLVVCDHKKDIITSQNYAEAVEAFHCRWCLKLDLERKKPSYGDVRVYEATESDIQTVKGR